LKFPQKVIQIAQDEEYGIWIVTNCHIYLYSINGDLLGQSGIDRDIQCISAIQLHRARVKRALICGTAAGEVFLAQPLFETQLIDFVKLPSPHLGAIVKIVVRPSGKSFVSIDQSEICCLWTAPGIKGMNGKITHFETCVICGETPHVFCGSCNRPLCRQCCMQPDGWCALCVGLNVY
jgi:hypothetical protein